MKKSLLCFAREQKDFHVIENVKEANFINSIEDKKKHSKITLKIHQKKAA
jgi:hypothetical protein